MYSAVTAPRLLTAITLVALAIAVFVIGVREGTFSAADTDPYGYVSQADLMTRGTLRVDQRFAATMPWPDAQWAFAPHGYVPSTDGTAIVPTYPIGLPMVMALVQRLSNQRDAVYFVVPVLGALTVLLTGWLGQRLHSAAAGVMSAILLASSPSFLNQVVQPVSDVPATVWWTASAVLALGSTVSGAFAGGLAASLAIVTRPNLVLLAPAFGALFVWNVVRADAGERRVAIWRLIAYAAGGIPGCLIVAAVHTMLYGSPLQTGYGPLEGIYSLANVLPNLDRYPRWLLQTQTPLIFLGVLAPIVVRHRDRDPRTIAGMWTLFAWSSVVLISYFVYAPWGWDDWGYLRFLLPAYPAMIVLSVMTLLEWLPRVIARSRQVMLAASAIVALVAIFQATEAVRRGAFALQEIERRYVDVGRYVRSVLPTEAAIVGSLHAGSVRYYSDRLTINFDRLPVRELDPAIRTLRSRGYRMFIVLEKGEEPSFRTRFAAHSVVGQLDWPPAHKTYEGVEVLIYDVEDRQPYLGGQPVITNDIGMTRPRVSTQK
jgi:hypothetical protein